MKAAFLSAAKGTSPVVAGVVAAGVAVAAVGKQLYDLGGEFEHANNIIRSGTGKTGKSLEELEGSFKKVVAGVPASFEEAATAVTELNKRLGLSGKPLEARAHQFLELSRMTGEDLPTAIKASARAFEDWQVPVKRQGKTLDEFFVASQKSGIGVEELSEQVDKFGPQLRNLHIPLGKAIALFASFEKAGVQNTKVGAALNLAFKNLVDGTANVSKKIAPEDTGKKVFELFRGMETGAVSAERALEVFGAKSGGAIIQAVDQGRFHVAEFQKQVEDSQGAINKTGDETKTTANHFTELGNKLKVLVAPAAELVYNTVNELSGKLAQVNFKKLLREMGLTKGTFKDVGQAIRALGTVLGPVLGTYLKAATAWFKGFMQEVKGISEIISGVLTGNFGKAWKGVKDIFSGSIKATFGVLRAMTGPVRGIIGDIGTAMGHAFSSAWKTVTGVFEDGVESVKGLVQDILDVINVLPGVDIHITESDPKNTAKGGLGKHKSGASFARGGPINLGAPNGDTVPAMLERGEYVLNRKAVAAVGKDQLDHLNFTMAPRHQNGGGIRGYNAGDVVSGIGHVASGVAHAATEPFGIPKAIFGTAKDAIGHLPTPHLPKWLAGLGTYVLDKVGGWIKSGFSSGKLAPKASGAGFSGPTPEGVGSWGGFPVDKWIIPELNYARAHGWSGPITSGYRTPQHSAELGYPGDEHTKTSYPGGAVDFGGMSDPAGAANRAAFIAATKGYKGPHLRLPIGFHDDGHMSGTGHALGGAIRGFSKGGEITSLVGGTFSVDEAATFAHVMGMPHPGVFGALTGPESGGNPKATNHNTNGSTDYGLWQDNSVNGATSAQYDPIANAKMALDIYNSQGFGAWATFGSQGAPGKVIPSLAAKMRAIISGKGSAAGTRSGKAKQGSIGSALFAATGTKAGPFGAAAATPVVLAGLGASALGAAAGGLPASIRHRLAAPGIGYPGRLRLAEQAMTMAEATEGEGDDQAARAFERELFTGREGQLQKSLNRVNKKLLKAQTPKAQKRLLAKREHIEEELGGVESSLSGLDSAEAQREEDSTKATEELASELKATREEMTTTRQYAERASATGEAVAWKALADIMSGQLGATTNRRASSAGIGSVGRI